MPRLFIAVKLDEPLKKELVRIQQELQEFDLPVRWVAPENIHLTLRFLGSVDEKMMPVLSDILKTVAGRHQSCLVELKTMGAFPSDRAPRMVWVGVDDKTGLPFDRTSTNSEVRLPNHSAESLRAVSPAEPLKQIYTALENALTEAGFEKDDHPFSPHLTLGRVKGSQNIEPLKKYLAEHKNISIGSQKVENITLFRSDLRPTGPIYTEEANFKLNL